MSMHNGTLRTASGAQRTLEDLFTHYLADNSTDTAASTAYQKRCFFDRVLREFGVLPLDEVTSDILRDWKVSLSERHTRATVYRYMAYLGCAFRFAVECGWLVQDPFKRVRKPPYGRGRVRFLTQDERQRLLAACRGSRNRLLYSIVVVALGTGGRKNEIRYLQWPEVDFERAVLRFLKTKTDVPRAVPLVGDARRILEDLAQRRRPGIPWVFPRGDGKQPTDIECAWRNARREAGLPDFRFHDLRHTFASYMAMSGASLRTIADVLGHVKIEQTMSYSHLLPSHTADMVQRMTQKFLEPPTEEGA